MNSERISTVGRQGNRRTLLNGLRSALVFVGDLNGVTGLYLLGRTLFVANSQGDVTLAGPVQGTEIAETDPASPMFSSVLAVHFSADAEKSTTGLELTQADHHTLKNSERLVRSDASGHKVTVALVVGFADFAPESLPLFAGNVRHLHPYGIVADRESLYFIDARASTRLAKWTSPRDSNGWFVGQLTPLSQSDLSRH